MELPACAGWAGLAAAFWGGAFVLAVTWVGSEWSARRLRQTSKRLLREHDAFWADFNAKLAERAPAARADADGERSE